MPSFFAYGRVSGTEDTSLSGQERQARARFRDRWEPEGYAWAGYFADREISGGVYLFDRPAGKLLASHMRRGDVLYVSALDRLLRSAGDWITLSENVLPGLGVVLDAADLGEYSTANGEMFAIIKAAIAQHFRKVTGERMRIAHKFRKANGNWCGVEPLGWRRTRHLKLAVDLEERAKLLALVRERDELGLTHYELYCRHRFDKSPRGRQWTQGGLKYALSKCAAGFPLSDAARECTAFGKQPILTR